MSKFEVGDRIRPKDNAVRNSSRISRIDYAGTRVYVLTVEQDSSGMAPWEYSETVGWIDSDYELVPLVWEKGKRYKKADGVWMSPIEVVAVSDDGDALINYFEDKMLATRRLSARVEYVEINSEQES